MRSSTLTVLTAGLGALLPGCMGPDPAEARPALEDLVEGQLPGRWTGAATAEGVREPAFWETFSDPVLAELVEEALRHNQDLAASAERLRGAAARSMVARSARRPQVQGRVDGSRQDQTFVGFPLFPGPLESQYDQWSAAIDLSWELDLWGKLAAGVDAAEAEAGAVAADLAAARLSVAAQVSIAWFALREASQQVALAEETLATFERSLKVVEDRHAVGLSGTLDLKLSEANVAGSRAQLSRAVRGRDVIARQIEVLLGRFPAAELEASGAFEGLPPAVPAGIPAEVLARRPDMVALERRMTAAEAAARQARLDRWPSLAITGSGGLTNEDFEGLLDGDFSVWSLATRLTAPIVDGGRRTARIEEALATLREVRGRFAAAALRAFLEVENALAAEALIAERLGHLELATLRSREATALAEDQYGRGLVSIELVLEAQRRELQAESAFLETRRELYQNRVDLHVALGGGFGPAFEGDDDGAAAADVGEGDADVGSEPRLASAPSDEGVTEERP